MSSDETHEPMVPEGRTECEGADILKPYDKDVNVLMLKGVLLEAFMEHIRKEYGPLHYEMCVAHIETSAGIRFPESFTKKDWYKLSIFLYAVDYIRKVDGVDEWDWDHMRNVLYGSMMEADIPLLRSHIIDAGLDKGFERIPDVWSGLLNKGHFFNIRLRDRKSPTFVCRLIKVSVQDIALCHIAKAIMEAVGHKFLGRRPRIKETACVGKGDAICEFVLE